MTTFISPVRSIRFITKDGTQMSITPKNLTLVSWSGKNQMGYEELEFTIRLSGDPKINRIGVTNGKLGIKKIK